jgi:hypothetical protein
MTLIRLYLFHRASGMARGRAFRRALDTVVRDHKLHRRF